MEFTPVFRMIVTSDIHTKESTSLQLDRFECGMKFAYKYADKSAYNKIDAFFAVGDFADSGSEKEMLLFKSSMDKVLRAETQRTLTLASHEFRAGGEERAVELFKQIFESETDNHKIINGFHCISISTEKGCAIKEKKQAWLYSELEKAAMDNPKKPIFCFQHPHISGTVYGSINWGDDDIYAILMNYPQVIDFSGHSHAPINDPRSVYQKYFTCFGTGSFNYFELDEFDKIYGTVPPDSKECAQYLIVEADIDNRVRVLPVDAITCNFFPCASVIGTPWKPESFTYTDERYKTDVKPVFAKDAEIDIEINNGNVTLEFPQAEISQDYVDSYTIVIRRKADAVIVKQLNVSSSYYLYNMPKKIKAEFDLSGNGDFAAEITAEGFWYNRSEALKKDFNI